MTASKQDVALQRFTIAAVLINFALAFAIAVAAFSTCGCGDDRAPERCASQIGDAEVVWAAAWCRYADRCFPDEFRQNWPDVPTCYVEVQQENCDMLGTCEDPYPQDRCESLDTCETEMDEIACDATRAPDSCHEAFAP